MDSFGYELGDTIVAASSSTSSSAISVIRISGADSKRILNTLVKETINAEPRMLIYGKVRKSVDKMMVVGGIPDSDIKNSDMSNLENPCPNKKDSQFIDECMAVYLPAPKTYTREDMAEIQIHGGKAVVKKVVSLCIQNGARFAKAGEFTYRAWKNGRIGIGEVEGIAMIVLANSDRMTQKAAMLLSGEWKKSISQIQEDLKNILVSLEEHIEFDQEIKKQEILKSLDGIISRLEGGLRLSLTDWLPRVVLSGETNVGKSSLFNALIGYEKAIVHETPCTTRDSVESNLETESGTFIILDTAGLTEDSSYLESIISPVDLAAIEKTKEKIKTADIIIKILDIVKYYNENLINQEETRFKNLDPCFSWNDSIIDILVLNKIDLLPQDKFEEITSYFQTASRKLILTSAKTGAGIRQLRDTIKEIAEMKLQIQNDELVLPSAMCDIFNILKDTLIKSAENIELPECSAVNIRNALSTISELLNEPLEDKAIERIFAKLCVGK